MANLALLDTIIGHLEQKIHIHHQKQKCVLKDLIAIVKLQNSMIFMSDTSVFVFGHLFCF